MRRPDVVVEGGGDPEWEGPVEKVAEGSWCESPRFIRSRTNRSPLISLFSFHASDLSFSLRVHVKLRLSSIFFIIAWI